MESGRGWRSIVRLRNRSRVLLLVVIFEVNCS